MIKPTNISPINTSKHLFFKCDKCGYTGTITLTNYIVNTDDAGNSIEPLDYDCQKCGAKL